jgi:Chromo (CHRromatin Organisation MOdifier) domain
MALSNDTHSSNSVSDWDSDTEYEVEEIVAEGIDKDDGILRYLVKWLGYKDIRNTWEPEENFLTPETLEDWREKKQRIAEGERDPFDVDDWERRREKWIEEEDRKRQDREFRKRKEDAEKRKEGLARLRARNRASERGEQQQDESSDDDDEIIGSEQRVKKRRRSRLQKERDYLFGPLSPTSSSAEVSTAIAKRVPVQTAAPGVPVPGKPQDPKPTESSAPLSANDLRELKPAYKKGKAAKGAGPARFNAVSKSNIFNSWDTAPRKRKRAAAQKPFNNLAHANATQKQGRNEPAPQLAKLQLFNPSDGSAVPGFGVRPKSSGSKPRTEVIEDSREDFGGGLFLTQSPSPPPQFRSISAQAETSATRSEQANSSRTTIHQNQHKGDDDGDIEMRDAAPLSLGSDVSNGYPARRPPPPPNSNLPRKHSFHEVPVWTPNTRHIQHIKDDPAWDYQEVKGHLLIQPTAFGGFVREKNEPILAKTSFFIRGLRSDPWWALFLRIKEPPRQVHVHIEQLCTASDYKRHYHKDGQGYYSIGYIPDKKEWSSLVRAYKRTELCGNQHGGLFFSPFYTLLVYPSKYPDWAFLDDHFSADCPLGELRFVFRSPVPRQTPNFPSPETIWAQELPSAAIIKQGQESEVSEKVSPSIIPEEVAVALEHETESVEKLHNPELDRISAESGMSLDDLFEKYFKRKWSEIVPPLPPTQGLPGCFLYYPEEPETVRQEHEFLRQILHVSKQCKVYSSHEVGEWERFTEKNLHGVVLVGLQSHQGASLLTMP